MAKPKITLFSHDGKTEKISLDEWVKRVKEADEHRAKRTVDWQRSLKPGDKYFRVFVPGGGLI